MVRPHIDGAARRPRGRGRGTRDLSCCAGPVVDGPAPVRSTAGRTGFQLLRGPRRRRPVDGRAHGIPVAARAPMSTAQRDGRAHGIPIAACAPPLLTYPSGRAVVFQSVLAAAGSTAGRRQGARDPNCCAGPAVDGPAAVRSTAGGEKLKMRPRGQQQGVRGSRRRRPSSSKAVDCRVRGVS